MLKILQARLQQNVSCKIPGVQADFRKGRGMRDQIASIRWIIEKAREFQKNIYFCFSVYDKAFDCVDHNKLWKILKEVGIPYSGRLSDLPGISWLIIGRTGMWNQIATPKTALFHPTVLFPKLPSDLV